MLFIRLLSARHGLALNHLRQTMQSVDVETQRHVVTGEEPLEVASPADSDAAMRHAAKGYQVAPLTGVSEHGMDASDWQVLVRNECIVLNVREGLAPAKLKQLRHITALVQAIVSND